MQSPNENTLTARQLAVAAALATLTTLAFVLWIGLRVGGQAVTLWVDDTVTPLSAFVACALCCRARARCLGRLRLSWSLLGCATGSWTVAEIVWGYYALIAATPVPVVSWADVGYLAAIPFAVAALVVHPATSGGGTRKTRWILDALVVATALLFLSWTLALGPLWRSTDPGTWAGVVALAYPFGDVVIVFFILLAIRGMRGGDRASLWCLLVALLAMALSDSTYTYLSTSASYSSPGLIDGGWVAAYLGIAVAAFSARPSVAAAGTHERPRRAVQSLVAPLVPVLAALVVVAVEHRLGVRLDRAAWLMAFALTALVLARQVLILVELLGAEAESRSNSTADLGSTAAHHSDSQLARPRS